MIKPMLAYKVDKKPVDWSEKVYIQPKLDGVRCVIYVNDKEEIVCFSRTGKEFHNLEHIKESLREFFFDNANVDIVLDGELYNHDLTFQEITRAVMTKDYDDPKVTKKMEKENDNIYEDRKSTRLNSSHTVISYAVFCL